MITILTAGTPGELYYTLYPFLMYHGPIPARIVTRLEDVESGSDAVVVLKKWLKSYPREQRAAVLTRLRNTSSRLVYVDDSDSPHSGQYDLIEYFDLFYQKQLLRERHQYTRTFIGNRFFCEYYARIAHLEHDTDEVYPPIPASDQLDKLRVLWNLGYGQYPMLSGPAQKLASRVVARVFGPRGHRFLLSRPRFRSFDDLSTPRCHARFGAGKYRPLVGYQRKLFLEVIGDNATFLSGRVPRRQYDRELRSVQAVLSPFGWGEVCYRDFESVIGGNVLVKPDMSHLETWPDIFTPDETYVSVAWDGSDLVQQVTSLLSDDNRMRRISRAAQERYRASLDVMDQRVERFIDEVTAKR